MSKLYIHENHPHQPVAIRVEDVREASAARGGLNARLAVLLTKGVATMWCAYLFALLAVLGFPGLLGPFTAQLVQWTSQTFIQLTMLAVLMVGQGLLGKHQEMVSEETAKTTQKSYHQIGQIVKHLNAQDEQILLTVASVKEQTDKIAEMSMNITAMNKTLAQLQRKASGV